MATTKNRLLTLLAAVVFVGAAGSAFAWDDHHDHGDWHDDHHGEWHDHDDHHDHWDHGPHDEWRGGPPRYYHDDPRWHERDRWIGWQETHRHHFVDWRPGYVYQPGQWVWYQGRAYEARVPVAAAVQVVPISQPGAWLDISARIPLN